MEFSLIHAFKSSLNASSFTNDFTKIIMPVQNSTFTDQPRHNKPANLFPLSHSQIKGRLFSFIIKGYGKRAKFSQSLFLFRIGLRNSSKVKSGLLYQNTSGDSLPTRLIPSSVFIKSKKKYTLFTLYSSNFVNTKTFIQSIIKLQGSSRKLPAFSYKDIGIRYFGKKPNKRIRRVS